MGGFLDYIPGDTFLHRLNPVTKLVLAFLLCAACFCAGSIPFVLGVIALNLLLAASAGTLPRALRLLLALAKLALMFFVIQLLFVQEGRALVNLPLGLMITDKGLAFSTLLALRLIGATAAGADALGHPDERFNRSAGTAAAHSLSLCLCADDGDPLYPYL